MENNTYDLNCDIKSTQLKNLSITLFSIHFHVMSLVIHN